MRPGFVVLAAVAIGAAIWLGAVAAAVTVYHHFTR